MNPSNIRLVVLDFDGVLTDGKKYYVDCEGQGFEKLCFNAKRFDMKDGQGLAYLRQKGIRLAVITRSKMDQIIEKRCNDIGIEKIYAGVMDKKQEFMSLCTEFHISMLDTAYMGDDEADISCLELAGLAACPIDAEDSVKSVCTFVSKRKGGKGAVRDLCNYIRGDHHHIDPYLPSQRSQ